MRNRPLMLAVPVVAMCAAPLAAQRMTPDSAEIKALCHTGIETLDYTDTTMDVFHPKYFVEVSEVSAEGTRRLIHAAAPNGAPRRIVCQRVNSPIDINSKMEIRINRGFLERNFTGGKFGITARLEGPAGSRPVEVPGYSVIGKATESVSASVADLQGITAAMSEIVSETNNLQHEFAAADKQSTSQLDDATQQREADRQNLTTVRAALARDTSSLRDAQAALAARSKPDLTKADSDQTASARTTLDAATARLRADSAAWREASVKFAVDSALVRGTTLRPYLIAARNILALRQHTLIAIEQLDTSANRSLVRIYARAANRLPEVIIRLSLSIDSTWKSVLVQDFTKTPDGDLAKWDAAVRGIYSALGDLTARPLTDDAGAHLLHAAVLQSMKDAEITVRQTGASVGDVLVVTIADTVGDDSQSRVLEIRTPISEFGFVRRVTDAVLLMNVPGIADDASLAQAQAAANTSGQGSSLTLPLNLRGSPSAGVSLTWTYLPRRNDPYALLPEAMRTFFDWWRPGIGMNASVINVAHRIVTITPGKPTSEAAKGPEVAYTFGFVASAFDAAVQWSVGRTLTSDRARTYTALGISFLAATDKAKDLFKELAK